MDIYTVLRGGDINSIDKIESFVNKGDAEGFAKENKTNSKDIGILESSVSANICDHEQWQVVQQTNHDLNFKCKECNCWILINLNEPEAQIKIVNLNNKECNNCSETTLLPMNGKIFKCNNCKGYNKEGNFIDKDMANEILDLQPTIEI